MKSMKSTIERVDIEELLKILGEEAPVGICIIQDGKFRYFNSNFPVATGYTADELVGKDSLEIVAPEDREMVRDNTIKMLKGELLSPYQFRVIHKDGGIVWIMATVKSIQCHRRRATLGCYMEVTERKQMEEALKESEEKYRELANSITDVFFAMDEHLRYTYWNKASEILTGIRAVDAIGKSLREIFPDTPGVRKAEKVYRKVLRTQQSQTFVSDVDIGGRHYIFEISAYPSPGGISVFVRDISERKQAEETLKQSEERYRTILEEMGDGYFESDLAGNLTFANDALCNLFGYSREELIGMNYRTLTPEEDVKPLFEAYNHVYRTGEPLRDFNRRVIRKDGAYGFAQSSAFPIRNNKGEIIGFRGVRHDITERKQAEDRLKESEQKYRLLFETSLDCIAQIDREGRYLAANPATAKSLGVHLEELVGKTMFEVMSRDVAQRRLERLRTALDEWQPKIYEDKREGRYFHHIVIPTKISDQEEAVQVITRDVTERKKMEESLRQSEEKYRALFDSSGIGMFVMDAETMKIVMCNQAAAKLIGFNSAEEVIGINPLDFVLPEFRDKALKIAIKEMFEQDLRRTHEYRVVNKDGREGWVSVTGARIMHEGRLAGLVSITDITERKQAVEALRQSEERYRTILEDMEDAYFETDLAGNITFANNSTCRDLGYSMEELIGKRINYKDYTVKEYIESVFRVFNEVYRTGVPNKGFSWKTIRKDGSHGFAETSVSPLRNDKGEIIGFRGVGRDVTERKQAEEKLRQSEENYKTLFSSSVTGAFVIDAETMKVVIANQAASEVFGFRSVEEAIGVDPLDFVPPGEREKTLDLIMKEMFERDSRKTFDVRAMTKDGREIWISATGARIMHEGRLAGLISFTDITERKQAEEKLRQSEENYKTLFNSSVVGMYVLDVETFKVVMGNQAAAEMAGFSSIGEGIGINPLDFVVPEDREQVLEMAAKEYEQDLRLTHEVRVIGKDGRTGWISISSARITHEGKPASLVSITNITERKRMEESLRQSEENYRALFDSSVIGTFVLDAETMKVVIGNQAAAKMFGFGSVEEAIGISPFDFIPPEDRERVLEIATKELFEQDLRRTHEVRAITKDSRKIWVSITGARIMHGGKLAGLISFTDITERKQTEEALRQSEENYRILFDSSVIGTIVLDTETMKVVMVNQAAAKMFGFSSAEEALGIDPLVFIRPDDRERILEIAAENLFGQDSRQVHELRAVTKDGREIWISATGARIMHEGRLAGLICFTDITEQKQQRERLMMTDRLASLGELAAGTAHELNNPLTSIIGFSQLLMEKEGPDDIHEDLKLINSEAQRAANVTKNLLTFARKHAPVKQPNQINSIIEDVLGLRAHVQKMNSIEVERHLAPDLPEIMVDYFQMQQVFLNIIINAEYFMTEAHNKGTLTITTKTRNGTVMISIADDGPGIPPENLTRIFDPFFTTKEAGKGTGLGLSICHGIVTEHGGQIYVRSQLSKGATVFVELPIEGRSRY
jgi:PAS domain S-box-containing protein